MVTLASDLASFHNSRPEEAVYALGAALRGEYEPARRFGYQLNAIEIGNKVVSKALDNRVACWLGIESVRKLDASGVNGRNKSRSKYGTKKPKAGAPAGGKK